MNATLLAAETLARVARLDGRPDLLEEARPTVAWALSRQAENGGWPYGTAGHHTWEDGFHTGFNLLSLDAIADASRAVGGAGATIVPAEAVDRGYAHYKATFFEADGFPRYYAHSRWPGDAHAAAVAIITLLKFADRDTEAVESAGRTVRWTLANLWNERGYFDYQLHRRCRIRIPYLRWSQAWMLLALARWQAAHRYFTSA